MQKILLTKGFTLYFKTAKKPGNLYMPQKLAQIVQLNGTHFDKSVLTDSSTRNKYNNISNNITNKNKGIKGKKGAVEGMQMTKIPHLSYH